MNKAFGILIFTFLIPISLLQAQQFGNEWIDQNKSYFKISVKEDGLYKVSYNDLLDAGFPLGLVDPRRIQVFHRGEEQSIWIEGQDDASFDPSDYLLFFGKKNDGTLDSALYVNEAAQPHRYYNLYSDESAYFLTWNLLPVNGNRIQKFFENNVGGLPAETLSERQNLQVLTDQYFVGKSISTYILLTQFDLGEGWTGEWVQEGESIVWEHAGSLQMNKTGPDAVLTFQMQGINDNSHLVDVFVGASMGTLRLLGQYSFEDFHYLEVQETLLDSDMDADGKFFLKMDVLGVGGDNDLVSLSYVNVSYPANFDVNGEQRTVLNLEANPGNKSYLEIDNVAPDAIIWDISTPKVPLQIEYNVVGAGINAIVPNTATSRTLWIEQAPLSVEFIEKAVFRTIDPTSVNYLILSNKALFSPAGGETNPVRAYAAYRSSSGGGGYDTLVYEMEEVMNTYNYGEYSPSAIYNLTRYFQEDGTTKMMFFIGKGLLVNTAKSVGGAVKYYRREPEEFEYQDLVPTAGLPGSDLAYSVGYDGYTASNALPTGRLTASTSLQVVNYLNKVKEMEALPFNNLWRKNLLHLSGGIKASELLRFESYVNGFKAVAEDFHFGAATKTISKESSSNIEFVNVSEEVNNGLNLITFYGHSSPSIIDIDIGYVSDPVHGYNNKGRYPSFLVNGCNAGQVFANDYSWGEDWLLTADKGALSFIAHSYFGYESPLKRYSDTFYATGYANDTFIAKSIGEILRETAKIYIDTNIQWELNTTQAQQMILVGDPAVSLFGASKADYEVRNEGVLVQTFDGEKINSDVDSLQLLVKVNSLAKVPLDDLEISVTRYFPDNSFEVSNYTIPAVLNNETVSFTLKHEGKSIAGENRVVVNLDPSNKIEEYNIGNNIADLTFVVPLSGTNNLLPGNYSIVNSLRTTLIAQTNDPTFSSRKVLVELDTAYLFNSPFKKSATLDASGFGKWEVDLLEAPGVDTTVYYWRSKYENPLPNEDDSWAQTSFTYINNGPEGWTQRSYQQLAENQLTNLQFDNLGNLEYTTTAVDVRVKTFGDQHPTLDYTSVELEIDGLPYIYDTRLCRDNTINLVAFNQETAVPYLGIYFAANQNQSCGRNNQVINNFTEAEVTGPTDYLTNYVDVIPEGDWVLFFTIGRVQFENWSSAILNKLSEIGVDPAQLSGFQNGDPIIIYGKKGSTPGTAIVVETSTLPKDEQEISLETPVIGTPENGSIKTDLIGAALGWNWFENHYSPYANGANDWTMQLSTVDNSGVETIALTTQNKQEDLSAISAVTYPNTKLEYSVVRENNTDPTQLEHWMIAYEFPPEGILIGYPQNESITVDEGTEVLRKYSFVNIGPKNFTDSLEVHYQIANTGLGKVENKQFKIMAPLMGDSTHFEMRIATLEWPGNNSFQVNVNPKIQVEQNYINNQQLLPDNIIVEEDVYNPIIDVAFDGKHIIDGDIVSPEPVITIEVKDESKVLFKKDTTGVEVYLKAPCSTCDYVRINFSDAKVQWNPASEKRGFYVQYSPGQLENGVYQLRVQGQDLKGNKAGESPFEVSFNVINEQFITHFYPYPNPFSTSVQFVFTLTGSTIPDEIKIQIMTVTGRVVREITQEELGPIRIGNNKTEFAWDGTDQFGDRLANGVYLYKVFIRSNGQEMSARATSADKAFKNGIGKIYILR